MVDDGPPFSEMRGEGSTWIAVIVQKSQRYPESDPPYPRGQRTVVSEPLVIAQGLCERLMHHVPCRLVRCP